MTSTSGLYMYTRASSHLCPRKGSMHSHTYMCGGNKISLGVILDSSLSSTPHYLCSQGIFVSTFQHFGLAISFHSICNAY